MPRIESNQKHYEYKTTPDQCPMCHHGIEAISIGSNVINRSMSSGDILQILFRCPRQKCQKAFIGSYRQNIGNRGHFPEGAFILRGTAPYYAETPNFPKEIEQISPSFLKIFSQSVTAEAYNLDQIAGVGYRKSLEYLIKDYIIHKNSSKTEDIKKSFLGVCINKYVDDANVKECARRAAWLGNDETHYVKKWEEKDIKDLKILIKLTQAWISNNLLTEKYLEEMI